MTSNKPYLIRAYYDWIVDNELTPHIAVDVSVYGVLVPMAHVIDGQIILNINPSAVGHIGLGEHEITFSARFAGQVEHIVVPYGAIGAIYAKENSVGVSLPIEHPEVVEEQPEPEVEKFTLSDVSASESSSENAKNNNVPAKAKGKPSLKVVK